ncbi:mycofactocin-coupled SDR family oxidoreductase [Pseudonocardia sp. TRM90224]|uniref:mycofactocin-coupled SDR family oxidoreductase n=1 Tax=Pseudonocardia sp. TRM90224 TaxID=2812678 RepID=UPI001E2A79A6|nr:mycofactocin-coupled SDR family oxidoreductase [Pseudonocardia sp. TRM90224]
MGNLDGKVALITGGARGQGRSHAVTLAGAGADIVVCDIAEPIGSVPYALSSAADLAETVAQVEKVGRRCVAVPADVRVQAELDAVVGRAVAELGHVDILLANAGIASYGPIAEMSGAQWQDMIDVNLTGVFNSFRAVVPHMIERRSGRIVATSSIVARMGATNSGHYAAAKWGVLGLVKSLALEVKQFGITVNAVLPSGVNTPMLDNPAMYAVFRPDLENPTRDDVKEMFDDNSAIEGLLDPVEVSNAILFLVSDAGRHLSGEAITMSGGMSAGMT